VHAPAFLTLDPPPAAALDQALAQEAPQRGHESLGVDAGVVALSFEEPLDPHQRPTVETEREVHQGTELCDDHGNVVIDRRGVGALGRAVGIADRVEDRSSPGRLAVRIDGVRVEARARLSSPPPHGRQRDTRSWSAEAVSEKSSAAPPAVSTGSSAAAG
jgi:hypothetical protein